MAEELQPLFRRGYYIFHNVPKDDGTNVDHVVAGPGGVFAVETKARTKQKAAADGKDYEALYDGKMIRFPKYTERESIGQALGNARWLASMLSKSTGMPVKAEPIVALRGWLVSVKVP